MTALDVPQSFGRHAGLAGYLVQAALVSFEAGQGYVEYVFHSLTLSDISPDVKRQIAYPAEQTVYMDSRKILGANLTALMASEWAGQRSLTSNKKVGDKLHISDNTVGRIRRGDNSIGIDMLDAIAELFDLESWQLLVPDLNPTNPPVIRGRSATERELYLRLEATMKALAELNAGRK